MPRAEFNGQVVAESDDTVVVDGNHYFPESSLKSEFFRESAKSSVCPWKGTASYRDVVVDGKVAEAAAWVYPSTKPEAKNIEGRFAFWNGVEVTGG